MRFVKVSRQYIQGVYDNACREIMMNHKETGVEKDRLNVLLVRIKYKGKNREFVIPLSHAIKTNKNHKLTYYPLDSGDEINKTVGGLFFKKCLPVNRNLYVDTIITKEPFLTVYKTVQLLENDIVRRFRLYLDEYVAKQKKGKGFSYSTNLDEILRYMDSEWP